MTKKDVRHTVPAGWMLGIPSIVRYPNDRPPKGGLYDRVFFGMLPVSHITNSHATRQTLLGSAPWLAQVGESGPDEKEAKAILENSPRVHWLGFRQDIPGLLKAFDITVVPSHWEGFGLVARKRF